MEPRAMNQVEMPRGDSPTIAAFASGGGQVLGTARLERGVGGLRWRLCYDRHLRPTLTFCEGLPSPSGEEHARSQLRRTRWNGFVGIHGCASGTQDVS